MSALAEPLAPDPGGRAALRIVQIGAVAAGLAASVYVVFDLDRFLVPKELVLHATALFAGLFAIAAMRRTAATTVDRLLILYLLLSAMSALFATNRWLAFRGFAISASSVLLFWVGRALRPHARRVVNGVAIGVIAIASTCLLQAYGLRLAVFALNRAPGGTLGNRNFIAHVAAFGLPLCLLAVIRARRAGGWMIGFAIVAAALVLTRSRAAWLATAAMALVLIVAMLVSGALRDRVVLRRSALAILLAGAGVAAALLLPNALHWRSENPYLQSLHGMTSYERGSGRGRLVQYGRSLRMAVAHPLFGVGPGNWAVDYPHYAAPDDPSIDTSDAGMTTNPWPSSDWIAFLAERGFAATALLALALALIALTALKQLHDAETATMLAMLAAVVVAGMFDALLLLPAPSLLVWTALGALWPASANATSPATRTITSFILIACAAAGAARSGAQIASMDAYVTRGDRASLERASHIDPSNFRLQLRLARVGRKSDRCEHSRIAHSLFPYAQVLRQVQNCR